MLFDLWGVVAADGYHAWLTESIPAYLFDPLLFDNLLLKFNHAEISENKFLCQLSDWTGLRPAAVREAILMRSVVDRDLDKLIRKLRACGLKMGLLARLPEKWVERILAVSDADALFDTTVALSYGQTDVAFAGAERAAAELFLPPPCVLCVQRKGASARALDALNMPHITYETCTQLESELSSAGVHVELKSELAERGAHGYGAPH